MTVSFDTSRLLLDDAIETCQRVATLARSGAARLPSPGGIELVTDVAGLLRLVAELADTIQTVAVACKDMLDTHPALNGVESRERQPGSDEAPQHAGRPTPAPGAVTGLILRTDGQALEQQFTTLTDYQQAVGGSITGVYLADGSVLYLDDDGLYKHVPHNPLAMQVARLGCKPDHEPPRMLVGDAVLIGPADATGEDTSVTDLARSWVTEALRTVR